MKGMHRAIAIALPIAAIAMVIFQLLREDGAVRAERA